MGYDLPSVHARLGSDLDEVVAFAHDVLIMLYDYDCVVIGGEILECCDESLIVRLVESYARLIEDVGDTAEFRADLRG